MFASAGPNEFSCSLGKHYQFEPDDQLCRPARQSQALSVHVQVVTVIPNVCIWTIDLGELGDNLRDEEIGTGILFIYSLPFSRPPTIESYVTLDQPEIFQGGARRYLWVTTLLC